jgi:hypothetical protein
MPRSLAVKKFLLQLAVLLGFPALATSAAHAQATQNGPYYATPSWDQTLPAATRFVVLSNFNNDAVLDRETGLVWARTALHSPSFPDFNTLFLWRPALIACHGLFLGNRYGWRLPAVEELLSLAPLPAGHPFQNAGGGWSATTFEGDTAQAYDVNVTSGSLTARDKTVLSAAWCVRGGASVANPN